ncbi:MAG: transcriptional activator HlyU [Brucellaceae bacterium]|nr:transcriptional activator HlyU [Brucellaceae bacterium]
MVSFLKSLFGGGKSEAAPAEAEAVPYNDCLIVPAPIKEGAQWRLAGFIRKEVGGVMRERKFIRSDLMSDRETAVQFAIQKAQLIIDQRSDLFSGSDDSSPV